MSGTIRIDENNLVFEIHGIDTILSIRRTISVPLEHVTSVSTDKVPWQPFQQMKVAGTSIPGIIKDGMFLSSDGLLFFEMHDPDKCITVSLDHERFKKIIFEVQDKEDAAKKIQDGLAK
ncbi:MAG: hypothetical protein KGI11_08130 [Thaumarchaeota archaeon]|nr:hypothetical protein [Nitrososphaerota archaeon]